MRTTQTAAALGLTILLAAAPAVARGLSAETDDAVGPEDVLEITVPYHPELNRTVTVTPGGALNFPEAGTIHAAGKVPERIAAEIRSALERTRNHAEVVVSIRETHSRRARVVGAVHTPGQCDIRAGWRLLDIIAVSGGLTIRPPLVACRIVRADGTLVTADVAEALAKPTSNANAPVSTGDLIVLEPLNASHNQVHVIGQVTRPGAFDLQDGATPLALISQAGGTTTKAALTRCAILHGTERIPVDLHRAVATDEPADPQARKPLHPGDILLVPEMDTRYAVMGQVRLAGFYPVPETGTLSVLSALGTAGGQTAEGDLKHAGIVRKVGERFTVIPVDIDGIVRNRSADGNLVMQPEDILYIPTRGRRFNWTEVVAPVSLLSYLGIRMFR